MSYRSVFVVLMVLVHAPAAPAADIPVSYIIDKEQLKATVTGTTLTWALYSNAACTTQAHSESALIDDVSILQEKPKKPSGEESVPKTMELRHTMMGVNARGNLYLQVTGTGITGVPACQPQAQATAQPPLTTVTVSVTMDFTDPSYVLTRWNVESHVGTGLAAPPALFPPEPNVSAKLRALKPTIRYTCNVEVLRYATITPAHGQKVLAENAAYYAPVYAVAGCVNACSDHAKNGNESDVDCGVAPCLCAAGKMCLRHANCQSNVCSGGICQP